MKCYFIRVSHRPGSYLVIIECELSPKEREELLQLLQFLKKEARKEALEEYEETSIKPGLELRSLIHRLDISSPIRLEHKLIGEYTIQAILTEELQQLTEEIYQNLIPPTNATLSLQLSGNILSDNLWLYYKYFYGNIVTTEYCFFNITPLLPITPTLIQTIRQWLHCLLYTSPSPRD